MSADNDSKPVLIWLDDYAETEISEILEKGANRNGLSLVNIQDINILAEKLPKINPINIKGVVVDLMLEGPNNLSAFGLDIKWDDDSDAGLELIKHVLKSEFYGGYGTPNPFREIKTLVLCVRFDIDEETFSQFPQIDLITKRDLIHSDWESKLENWVIKL